MTLKTTFQHPKTDLQLCHRSGDSISRGGGTNWKHSSSTSNEYKYILWYRMGCHNPMNNSIERNTACCLTMHIISNINSLPNIIALHPKCVHKSWHSFTFLNSIMFGQENHLIHLGLGTKSEARTPKRGCM